MKNKTENDKKCEEIIELGFLKDLKSILSLI